MDVERTVLWHCLLAGMLSLGLARGVAANPPLTLVKTMFPLTVVPGDTVTICLNVTQPSTVPQADILWVLDTTGSMSTSIAQLKANITAFTNQLALLGINYRQGLYTFWDFPNGGGPPDLNYGFATSDAQFLTWVNTAQGNVGGGADWPENSLDAVAAAAAGSAWRPTASHTIIVVSDAAAHAQGYDNLSPLNLTTEAATLSGQGFVIDAISNAAVDMAPFSAVPPALLPFADLSRMPPLAGGMWLDISYTASAWNAFMTGLGGSVGNYSQVVLSDPLPPQLDPIPAASDGAAISGNTLSWTVSDLGAGQGFSHCVLAVAKPGYYGPITNTAQVDANGTSSTSTLASPIYYATYTFTRTPSPTVTLTPTVTPSFTQSETHTITPTFTVTPTLTPTVPPLVLTLYPPNPDPAPDALWLPWGIATDARVDLQVWTLAGEPVRRFPALGLSPRGVHETRWDLGNDAGAKVASGVYIYRVRARSPAGEEESLLGKCAVAR